MRTTRQIDSVLSDIARQQAMIRRLSGGCALEQLAVSVAEFTGADLVAAGLLESPGAVRVTASAGSRADAAPDVIEVDEGRVVAAESILPDARAALWVPLQLGLDTPGGVVLVHSGELPDHTSAALRILAATVADVWQRPGGGAAVGPDGDAPGLTGHVLDVAGYWPTAERLSRSDRQFQAAFELAPFGMLLVAGDGEAGAGRILRANRAFAELAGRDAAEFVGMRTVDVLSAAHREASLRTILEIGGPGHAGLTGQRRLVRPDGQVIDVLASTALLETGGPQGPVLIWHVQDVTRANRQARELERMARTDPLTGVGNRTQLRIWLDEWEREGTGGALFVIDLDRFKSVNDRFGHRAGDELLVAVTSRLTRADPRWRVSRLGGDEFVVLVAGVPALTQAREEGERIAAVLAATFDLPSGASVSTSASIGVAVHEPGLDGEEVQRRADLALYRAKRRGRSWVSVCDEEVLARAQRLRTTESLLRDALARGAIDAWLQPIVDLDSGRVTGYEALARAADPQGTVFPAQDFVEVAENTGLISEVDHLVMAAVGRLMTQDPRLHDPSLRISVNVSSQTLTQPSFLLLLGSVLATDRPQLVLEVTEHSLLEDDPQVRTTFDWLRDAGIELAVDDFGTGYSALAYLRQFRMHHLKVDRSFVQGLGTDRGATSTVRAVIDVAHAHGMSVVAEGIETREQADELLAMGADRGQGYFFGRPAPHTP